MKLKEQYFSEIENNPTLHQQYWLNQMLNHHYEPLQEKHYEKDLSIPQYEPNTFSLNRRETVLC